MKKRLGLASFALFAFLLMLWQAASSLLPRVEFLFGSPASVGRALFRHTIHGSLPMDFVVTGAESLIGFVIGIILGTVIGFLLWYSPFVARLAKPYLLVLGAVPVFAFAPMVIVWFGIGFGMKVAMAALGTFLVALAQAYEGAKSVNEDEFRLLKLFGATRMQMLQKVIFPSSLSWVLASMKLNVGFALLGAFIGEFISSGQGLGHFMIRAGSLYDIPAVFAGGIYLVLLALILHALVLFIERRRTTIIHALSVTKS